MSDVNRSNRMDLEINTNSDNYDGRKDVLLERTFRFRDISEFITLTTRERARIIRAQKEREEYENSWRGVKSGCTCQYESNVTKKMKKNNPQVRKRLQKPEQNHPQYIPTAINTDKIKRTRSTKQVNSPSARNDDFMKFNSPDNKPKKGEKLKNVRFEDLPEFNNIEINNLDDIISSQAINDFI